MRVSNNYSCPSSSSSSWLSSHLVVLFILASSFFLVFLGSVFPNFSVVIVPRRIFSPSSYLNKGRAATAEAPYTPSPSIGHSDHKEETSETQVPSGLIQVGFELH